VKAKYDLPELTSVAWSAFRCGGLRSMTVRPRQSGSSGGWVLVCRFASAETAGCFAARWAGRLGFPCRVRAGNAVSVGVRLPACLPLGVSGRLHLVKGGVRGMVAMLAGLGVQYGR
jgi:hypothetical protein